MKKRKTRNKLFTIFTTAMLASLLIVASGCASSKKGSTTGTMTIKELQTLPALKSTGKHLSAKLKISTKIKGSSLSASGNIKIKRGEGLQISINALGGFIEVARIEATPERMLLINRLGREYTEITYKEVEILQQLGIDYAMLEAILLNEPFAPDGRPLDKELRKMEITTANGEILLSTTREKGMQYNFHIEQNNGRLILTRGDYNNRININCNYSDFTDTGTRPFPQNISFSAAGMSLRLTLSNIKESSFKLNKTSNLSSYKKTDAANLLKKLNF